MYHIQHVDVISRFQQHVTSSNEYHYSPTHDSLVTLHAFIKRSLQDEEMKKSSSLFWY